MKAWIPIAALLVVLSPLGFVHPVKVVGQSMEPLLADGSIRLAMRSWCAGTPSHGQVWLLAGPDGPIIKRLIALPGERLEQREGELYLDGQRLSEPYILQFDQGDVKEMEAGSGYLVLGDNRRMSHDSRLWGSLPRSALRARILGI